MTFDAMPDLVAILDQDGRIRRLNKSLARRSGRPLRELIGSRWWRCCPSARSGSAAPPPARRPARSAELQEAHTGAVYEANLLQIHGPTPILGERVVILRDVTEQREMARRMAAFERRAATGDLLSGVAHEVRNPLAAVQAAAEALGLDAEGDPDQTLLVDIIQKQVDRLSTLMSDLLDVARPSPPSARRRESLVAFCRSALDAWSKNPARPPRVVRLHAPPGDELPVLIERQRLEQVLVNLLDNAAEHSPADTRIDLRAGPAAPRPGPRARDRPRLGRAGRRTPTACSSPSSRRAPTAPAWASPSPRASWRTTAAASAPGTTSRARPTVEFTLPLAPESER